MGDQSRRVVVGEEMSHNVNWKRKQRKKLWPFSIRMQLGLVQVIPHQFHSTPPGSGFANSSCVDWACWLFSHGILLGYDSAAVWRRGEPIISA
jgi:hypothetical protein